MHRFQEIDIRGLLATHPLKEVHEKISEDMKEKKLDPRTLSLRRLWEHTVGPVDETLDLAYSAGGFVNVREDVNTTAFAIITGSVISNVVIDAYNARTTAIQDLVTVVPSNRKTENVVGFQSLDSLEAVNEGMPYQDSGMQEKYVVISNQKYGRILSITEEAIQFDQTGQLLARAAQFGEKAAVKRDRVILEGVIDLNYSAGVAGVYRPSGTYTDLYSTALSTLTASAGTISDANLNTAYTALRSKTDENGDYIVPAQAGNLVLMCHPGQFKTAMNIQNTSLVPGSANNDNNFWKGFFKTVVDNPYISASTTWFIGDFKSQFRYQEVWPLQVMRAIPGNDFEFQKDIKAAFKVRFYGGIGAVDYRYVHKCTT